MKFVVGLLVGVGMGVAATLLLNREEEEDEALTLVGTVQTGTKRALESAKAAATQREKELWREFHERVPTPDQQITG